ncbi:uncharacterized protein L201_000936 [Kwoniella dendrophila CBS 6074]|uniref:Uncharacterized protein n=1 Tax=Kwoniella dendrophila CBS 6074 TaxID=1295534 RepID=A0AAX4JKZ2_9TREE
MTQYKPLATPSTPSQQSSSTLSPPLSPSSSHPAPSDDDFPSDLSDSWLAIEELEERSSVGPSVLGDVFSDTSSDDHGVDHETQSQWSASSDGGRDADIEDGGAVILEPQSNEVNSPSLDGYTDAEASTSKLDSSIDTLHTSSDQIRLIFPDGASFTTSSSGTLSAGFTPSASISGLTPMTHPDQAPRPRAVTTVEPAISTEVALGKMSPRRSSSPVRRGIEDSWLKSSKLWTPLKQESVKSLPNASEYQLLRSTDDLERVEQEVIGDQNLFGGLRMPIVDIQAEKSDKSTTVDKAQDFRELHNVLEEKRFRVGDEARDSLKDRALEGLGDHSVLASSNVNAMKTAAKKWFTRVSYFALASFLSVTLLRTFGSNLFVPFVAEPTIKTQPTESILSAEVTRSSSIWDRVPFVSPFALSSLNSPNEPTHTAVQPDARLIDQAFSTLSSIHQRLSSAATDSPSSLNVQKEGSTSEKKQKDVTSRSSTSCCSISVRNNNVALTIPPLTRQPDGKASIARRLSRKLLRVNKTDHSESNATAPAQSPNPSCTCSLSTTAQNVVYDRLATIFGPASIYGLATTHHLGHILQPILANLEAELRLLYSLTSQIIRQGITVSNATIHQAAKGAVIAMTSVDNTVHRINDIAHNFFTSHTPFTRNQPLASASDMLDSVSDYIETHFDALADSLEEQAENMQEKSWDHIYKARRGLDRLIRDYKKMRGVEDEIQVHFTDIEKDGPLPFSHMKRKRSGNEGSQEGGLRPTRRGEARKERRKERKVMEKALRGNKVKIVPPPPPIPPMEKSSKGKTLLDMVHHVSIVGLSFVIACELNANHNYKKGAMALVL